MFRGGSSSQERVVLEGVSWLSHERLARALSDRRLDFTYDRGKLEMKTNSHERQMWAALLGRLVIALTEELAMPILEGRSIKLMNRRKKRGLAPDNCYWIEHEADVRANKRIDLRSDPPPDLAIEVDIAGSVLNRMGVYTSLRIPEVWRYNVQGLAIYTLNSNRRYILSASSSLFSPPIAALDLMPFLAMRGRLDQNEVIRQFRRWLRER
jgi:Uma2 family endonuclease